MATYFTALSAVVAHQMSQHPDTAPAADQAAWWFRHDDLWLAVAAAVDAGPDEVRRARELAELCGDEAWRHVTHGRS